MMMEVADSLTEYLCDGVAADGVGGQLAQISDKDVPMNMELYHRLLTNPQQGDLDAQHAYRLQWVKLFDDFQIDVLVAPISPTVAFYSDPLDDQDAYSTPGRYATYIDCFNNNAEVLLQRPYHDFFFWPHFSVLGQLPATAVRLDVTDGGLPVGLQVIAPPYCDMRCIRFASLLQDMMMRRKGFDIDRLPRL
jgi:amidase